MKSLAEIGLIAGVHIGTLFTIYTTDFFGMQLPSNLAVVFWLIVPSVAALAAYYWALSKSQWLVSISYRNAVLAGCALAISFVSFTLGVSIAMNHFQQH